MIGKFKNNRNQEEGSGSRGLKEKAAEKKALSGSPKIALAGLGVLILMLGVGFVFMQAISGGGKSRQQMLTARQAGQNSQTQSEQDETSQQTADRRADAGNGTNRLKKPSAAGERSQPDPDSQKVPARAVGGRMGKILEQLTAIKESMETRMDRVSEKVEDLKGGIAENGDRIDELAGKAGRVSGAQGWVAPEKYTALLEQKNSLEKKVADLEKKVKDLKGKYDWVRHLESSKRIKLKKVKQELAEAREKIKNIANRFVFGEWQLAGLSTEEMLLVNPYNGHVKRLQAGESFKGVTVEHIDFENGRVRTDAGVMELG